MPLSPVLLEVKRLEAKGRLRCVDEEKDDDHVEALALACYKCVVCRPKHVA